MDYNLTTFGRYGELPLPDELAPLKFRCQAHWREIFGTGLRLPIEDALTRSRELKERRDAAIKKREAAGKKVDRRTFQNDQYMSHLFWRGEAESLFARAEVRSLARIRGARVPSRRSNLCIDFGSLYLTKDNHLREAELRSDDPPLANVLFSGELGYRFHEVIEAVREAASTHRQHREKADAERLSFERKPKSLDFRSRRWRDLEARKIEFEHREASAGHKSQQAWCDLSAIVSEAAKKVDLEEQSEFASYCARYEEPFQGWLASMRRSQVEKETTIRESVAAEELELASQGDEERADLVSRVESSAASSKAQLAELRESLDKETDLLREEIARLESDLVEAQKWRVGDDQAILDLWKTIDAL